MVQPVFMSSDRLVTASDTLTSACVASDRSGNERAVQVVKRSHYITKGLRSGGNPSRLNDVWESWSFMANFIYKPVH